MSALIPGSAVPAYLLFTLLCPKTNFLRAEAYIEPVSWSYEDRDSPRPDYHMNVSVVAGRQRSMGRWE